MTEAEHQSTEDSAAPPRRRIPRRHYWRAGLMLLIAPLLFAGIAAVMLVNREITAPTWIKTEIEERAEELLNGGSLRFGTIRFILGPDLHPRVRLTGAVLRDADGVALARIPEVEGLLSPRGLITGQVLAQEVRLSGAQVNLRRGADGRFALSFGAGGTDVGSAETFAGLLESIDTAVERPELAALERVAARGLIINYGDARAGRTWTVDGGRMELDLTGGETVLRGDVALLGGRASVTTVAMSYASPRGSASASLGITVTDAVATDIASQTPALAWLDVLEAPISAAIRGEIDADGALGRVDATLEIGTGALQPTAQTRPIRFDAAKAYLSFDPGLGDLEFSQVEIESDWGTVTAQGQAYLRDIVDGWPGAVLGQFTFAGLRTNPGDLYAEPLSFDAGAVDMRLKLDPFTLTVGQASLRDGEMRLDLSGQVRAAPEGWSVALDAALEEASAAQLLGYWPASLKPNTRRWFAENLIAGQFRDLRMAARLAAGARPILSVTSEFSETQVRFMRTMPPIEEADGHLAMVADDLTLTLVDGHVQAPQGGRLDVGGTVFQVPDLTIPQPPATVLLRIDGTLTAAMALLDREPFGFLSRAGLPVALADGRARIAGAITLPLKPKVPRDEIDFSVVADLRDVRTERLVPGRVLAAPALDLRASADELRIEGAGRLGRVPVEGVWRQPLGEGPRPSRFEGTVQLSEQVIDEFNIGLPPGSLGGQGRGDLVLDLPPGGPPGFRLTSDLRGLRVAVDAVGWSKGANAAGTLVVAGQLGAQPRIDELTLRGPGFDAAGRIELATGGGLSRAVFDRVRVAGWFDGPVTLIGRGAGRAPNLEIGGGALDLREMTLGGGGGEGGTVSMRLDRLQVTEGIALTGVQGSFTGQGGFSGQFAGRVNGGAPVQGTIVPQGGRSAIRIVGDDAGGILASAGLLPNAARGTFDLVLQPVGSESFDGTLDITNLRVRDAPALASLLDAISVVGLLQQLDGQGLSFTEVDAEFRIEPGRIVITRSSAVGPSLGISLDGIYATQAGTVDLQGVVSPIYLLNGIGAVLTRPGEGLIGFNFNLTGPVSDMAVMVNPLSVLTPGMFREIFRRPPPQVSQ